MLEPSTIDPTPANQGYIGTLKLIHQHIQAKPREVVFIHWLITTETLSP